MAFILSILGNSYVISAGLGAFAMWGLHAAVMRRAKPTQIPTTVAQMKAATPPALTEVEKIAAKLAAGVKKGL